MNHYTDNDEYMYGNKVNERFITPYKEVKLLIKPKRKIRQQPCTRVAEFLITKMERKYSLFITQLIEYCV